MMVNVIDKARITQQSVVVTLLELKNAFGEVHHKLIPEILKYHHIPDHMQHLILSLYLNFQTSILTTTFRILFITVGRGVLRGDCLSSLTFNLCFNTVIHCSIRYSKNWVSQPALSTPLSHQVHQFNTFLS